MKRFTLLVATAMLYLSATAQKDSTRKDDNNDTIRIGNIIIVKHGKNRDTGKKVQVTMGRNEGARKRNSGVSTSWWNIDLGFSNYIDNTNYGTAGNYLVNRPGYPALGVNDFKLNNGKSVNVNIWIVTQKLSLIRHFVNLKYGLGLELNNYRYKTSVSYKEGGPVPYTTGTQAGSPFIFRDSISFSKNKLAADYLTVPFMLNFVTNPNQSTKGLVLSAGVSAGYLYSERNKQISNERGKRRNRGDYDLERFKISYIAELGLGPIRLYGSYSPASMYNTGMDIKPYTIGFRLTNW